MMPILSSIGTWILKLFLSGLFNKVMTKIEMEAEAKKQQALLQAQTTEEAAKVEIEIAKKQAQAAIDATQPKPVDDPFNTDKWNRKT